MNLEPVVTEWSKSEREKQISYIYTYIWNLEKQYVHAKLLQACSALFDLMDCSLPGSSVYGILQERIPKWAAMPSSRSGSSWPRDRTCMSCSCCTAGRFFLWATREMLQMILFTNRNRDTNVWTPSWEEVGGMNWKVGIDIYTLLILCINR